MWYKRHSRTRGSPAVPAPLRTAAVRFSKLRTHTCVYIIHAQYTRMCLSYIHVLYIIYLVRILHVYITTIHVQCVCVRTRSACMGCVIDAVHARGSHLPEKGPLVLRMCVHVCDCVRVCVWVCVKCFDGALVSCPLSNRFPPRATTHARIARNPPANDLLCVCESVCECVCVGVYVCGCVCANLRPHCVCDRRFGRREYLRRPDGKWRGKTVGPQGGEPLVSREDYNKSRRGWRKINTNLRCRFFGLHGTRFRAPVGRVESREKSETNKKETDNKTKITLWISLWALNICISIHPQNFFYIKRTKLVVIIVISA